MTTAELLFWALLLHFVGDYVIQSDWMATRKIRQPGETRHQCAEGWAAVLAHGITYTVPFLVITTDPVALAIIGGTHVLIDRYRLARHVIWAKNQVGPRSTRRPWRECVKTGYNPDVPIWLAHWLMVVVDNTIHVAINSLTIVLLVAAA